MYNRYIISACNAIKKHVCIFCIIIYIFATWFLKPTELSLIAILRITNLKVLRLQATYQSSNSHLAITFFWVDFKHVEMVYFKCALMSGQYSKGVGDMGGGCKVGRGS